MRLILLATVLFLCAAQYSDARNQQAPSKYASDQGTGKSAAKDGNGRPAPRPQEQGGNAQIFNYSSNGQQANAETNKGIRICGITITSDWVMVALTLALVVLTFAYVIVAYWQVSTVHDTERAWMVVNPKNWNPGLAITPPQGGEIPLNVFQMSTKNVGNTPARIIETGCKYIRLEKMGDLPDEPNYGESAMFNDMLFVPNDSIGQIAPLSPSAVLSQEEATKISNAQMFLYAYGFVAYKDAFGKLRRTRWGYEYRFPQGGLVSFYQPSFQRAGPRNYNDAT